MSLELSFLSQRHSRKTSAELHETRKCMTQNHTTMGWHSFRRTEKYELPEQHLFSQELTLS